MRRLRRLGWILLGAFVVGAAVRWLASRTPAALPPAALSALAADGLTPLNQPAPPFHLVDQYGRPVSLATFRGRVVVLTFFDPVCWWDCPLQAAELAQVDALLGRRARRVALVAIAGNPLVHSRAALQAFDAEHGLTALPNWTFATGSLPALRAVWRAYGYQVQTVVNGMVPHTDLYYVIGPDGHERDLLNPLATRANAPGTAELLAATVARLLGTPVPRRPAAAVPPPPTAPALGPPGPVAVWWTRAQIGWARVNDGPYQVVAHTTDGGRTWTDVGPPGLSKRGGTLLAPVSGRTAWAVVRPYSYQQDALVFRTTTGGQSWTVVGFLPGPVPTGDGLAAAGPQEAAVLAGGRIWITRDGGLHWQPGPRWPAGAHGPFRLRYAGTAWWLGGAPAPGGALWRWAPGTAAWQRVAVPAPPAWPAVRVAPPIPLAGGTLAAVLVRPTPAQALVVTSRDGGRTWTAVTPPVAVVASGAGAFPTARGWAVLHPVPFGVQIWVWRPGQRRWTRATATFTVPDAVGLAERAPGAWTVWVRTAHTRAAWVTADAGALWQAAGGWPVGGTP